MFRKKRKKARRHACQRESRIVKLVPVMVMGLHLIDTLVRAFVTR